MRRRGTILEPARVGTDKGSSDARYHAGFASPNKRRDDFNVDVAAYLNVEHSAQHKEMSESSAAGEICS